MGFRPDSTLLINADGDQTKKGQWYKKIQKENYVPVQYLLEYGEKNLIPISARKCETVKRGV